ncbi:hypothetical protein CYLTODRAFT_386164 [Cylindrobasidium torrendii FP15055 ss-10]|uniref:BTB domain-containing protein n=1 Tax=Cylindrobasidium torrendii FP15055 ss-10 TaxID=1314674 RepID=A0A0D7BUS9_9AGAR|nr:hypothetical protein CYLTODRAFT_386164 [Cylindrobasidium torrendii FP15055 ss-10]
MIQPSPSIWFEDGNVVLIAEKTAFKVHRGQLARHSEVFDGLFSLPVPMNSCESFDGCPSVQMHGDQARDWRYFLGAIYDGLYFPIPRQNDFPLVSSVLRLSTKYLVEPLRVRCLARLQYDYPPDLSTWDQREQEATNEEGYYSPRDQYAHPIRVIQLSIELGLPDVLPAAFYDLSRYGPSRIVEGSHIKDANLALPLPLVARTLRGRELAQEFLAKFILGERAPSELCTTPSLCAQSLYFITLNLLRAVGGLAAGRDADPLYTLIQALDMLERSDFETASGGRGQSLHICPPCKVMFASECLSKRLEAWKCIPDWFMLEKERRDSKSE